jgi:hypothetical protein
MRLKSEPSKINKDASPLAEEALAKAGSTVRSWEPSLNFDP